MCRVAGGNRTPRLDRRCCQPAVNHVPWHRFGCRQAQDSPDRASFLDELDLRRGTPEEPRQVGEVKDAAGQPNQAEQFRLTVEMEKQVDIHDGPNGRKDDVAHHALPGPLGAAADEYGDHAAVSYTHLTL